ncbi:MAG: LytR C-terminal domain-containing protein [Acidimicrobiales bacterium]
MTGPGRYAASDGSFARSAGLAAARRGADRIAVLLGLVLLWKGFDGGDDPVAAGPGSSEPTPTVSSVSSPTDTTGSTDTTSPDPNSTAPTGSTDPTGTSDDPSTVKVVVLNGSGEPGLAGTRTDVLATKGYVAVAGNTAADAATSKVYYIDGYAEEAAAVAAELSGTADLIEPIAAAERGALAKDDAVAEAEVANVIVVLGSDGQLR